jgi:hypothetical protein
MYTTEVGDWQVKARSLKEGRKEKEGRKGGTPQKVEQEDYKFENSLGYTVRLCLKTNQQKRNGH